MRLTGFPISDTIGRSVVDERSDNELLAAYARGDARAFGEFARRYQSFLVSVAAKRLGAAFWHDAEEAASEAWIAVMAKAATDLGPEGVGDVKSWLASFVLHKAMQISSGYARRDTPNRDPRVLREIVAQTGYRLPGASGPAETVDDTEPRAAREARADALKARFAQALAELTVLQREVMTYRLQYRDMTALQIAAELGRTLDSVKHAEQAGRRNLRRALGDVVGEQPPAPVNPIGARRQLLAEQLRTNPAMTGLEAKTVLDEAGHGPVPLQRAYKLLVKARADQAADQAAAQRPHAASTVAAPGASWERAVPPVTPRQVRAARLRLLTERVRRAPQFTVVEARTVLHDAGLGPVAWRTTRRLLAEARVRAAGPDPV